jgi:hypothetical protein
MIKANQQHLPEFIVNPTTNWPMVEKFVSILTKKGPIAPISIFHNFNNNL